MAKSKARDFFSGSVSREGTTKERGWGQGGSYVFKHRGEKEISTGREGGNP